MVENCLDSELEILDASYNSNEFTHFSSGESHILKFNLWIGGSATFEVRATYPEVPPSISLSFSELKNVERIDIENKLRSVARNEIGSPMIMNLVTELQHMVDLLSKPENVETVQSCETDCYTAVILIDHMRQKKKYCKSLNSWASELSIYGVLLFCQKWIFLILQGSKKCIKEFIIRLRTACVDVDSSHKPCKERMSKILYEGENMKCFSTFSKEEISNVEDIENYFISSKLQNIYSEVIKPVLK